jgi:hypothetical protein
VVRVLPEALLPVILCPDLELMANAMQSTVQRRGSVTFFTDAAMLILPFPR